MNTDQLVHMANRIGEFFESFPDHAQAVAGVAEHIQKFWAPSMRQALMHHIDQGLAHGLSPLVREALCAPEHHGS
jgi:formate dehydrogenase subunit delta